MVTIRVAEKGCEALVEGKFAMEPHPGSNQAEDLPYKMWNNYLRASTTGDGKLISINMVQLPWAMGVGGETLKATAKANNKPAKLPHSCQ
jgi:hypothetical protein